MCNLSHVLHILARCLCVPPLADLNRVDMCNLSHVVHILARYLRSRRFPPEGPQLMRELLAAGASVHGAVYPPALGEEGEVLSKDGVAPSPIDALLGIDGWGNGPEQDIRDLPGGTNVPELIRCTQLLQLGTHRSALLHARFSCVLAGVGWGGVWIQTAATTVS